MADNVEQTETPQEQKQSSRNLTPLFEANGDCIGWICIPNTAVNYPVMFTPEEPQKYLRKNFEGEYSVSGIPFLDGASTPECDNLIVYGHNMKNGTMFSDVTQYRDNSNLVRKVITLSNKVYVDVLAEFSKDGLLIPKEITWEDGRKYEITRVKDKRRAASTRAGGVGERYTCVVDGKEIFLFYEDNNMWFMERAGA